MGLINPSAQLFNPSYILPSGYCGGLVRLSVCVHVSKVRGSLLGDFLNCLHLIFETESNLNLDSPDQLDWRTGLSNLSAVIAQCRDAPIQDFLLGCENLNSNPHTCVRALGQ